MKYILKMDFSFWPRLNKCCCCIPLRVGSLIIGYGSLITATFSLAGVSFSLYRVVAYMASHAGRPDPQGHSPEEVAKTAMSLYISHAYFMLVLLYYCAINLLLIIGIHKNKAHYLRYYFLAAFIQLALAFAMVVITSVFFGILATIPLLKWCIILFYFVIVVRSTYLEMEDSIRAPMYEMKTIHNIQQQQQAPLIQYKF